MGGAPGACDACLGRAWLLSRLAPNLEPVRARIEAVLALEDGALIDAVGGAQRAEIAIEARRFDAAAARARSAVAGIEAICRCEPRYPARLAALTSPPAVLHVAGGLDRFLALVGEEPVAIVGARSASSYGLEVARQLGRGLGAAGISVVSGMALGTDSAAHAAAIDGGGATVAVLPGSADRPYPAAKRALHARIRRSGAIASELPPGAPVWRWMFPARNRIIAALSEATIVVEAGRRSGALVTARIALGLGRTVGAVPGHVTAPLAEGPNALLASGAVLIRGPQDVLDQLYGAGVRVAAARERPRLEPVLEALLEAIAGGQDTPDAIRGAGLDAGEGLAALASLELAGHLRRGPGGSFVVLR